MLETWPEYLARKAAEVEPEAPKVKRVAKAENKAVEAADDKGD